VDATVDQLVQAQLLVSGVDTGVDLYLLSSAQADPSWLYRVLPGMHAILINGQTGSDSIYKQTLAGLASAKVFGDSQPEISVTEHLARLIYERQNSSSSHQRGM
jgi:hypothetical protein